VAQQRTLRSGEIIDELRRRIESGELAPGERVPSTREITRQWGVAMATATKVLTELRREGLVRAVPGVGTVVESGAVRSVRTRAASPGVPLEGAPGPGRERSGGVPAPGVKAMGGTGTGAGTGAGASGVRRGGQEQTLTLDRIVAAAMEVADVEGLDAASMRRVAAELGVATMSLYRHVADKDDLLLRMMDVACSGWTVPADPQGGWRERLTLAARMLWAICRRHPWLAPALSVTRPQMVPSALPFTEWVLASLDGRGLPLSTVFTAHITLFNYVRGTAVNVEMEQQAEAQSGLDSEEWMDSQEPVLNEMLETGRFPTLQRVTASGYDFDLDELFEFGLQRLLDGFAVLLGEPPVEG